MRLRKAQVLVPMADADLQGDAEALLRDLLDRLNAAGFATSATMANTWGAAHALARFRTQQIMIAEPGVLREAIAPLPLAALRLSLDIVAELRMLGFETVSDFLAQPRAPLALRFGPELGRRLDQALGLASEPIDPVRPPSDRGAAVLRRPIGAAETIKRYIGKLVGKLCLDLEDRNLGVRRLDLICYQFDSHFQTVRVGTAMPVAIRSV